MKTSVLSLALALCAASAPAQTQALRFQNGVDNYADVAYHATILPQTGLTVEAWVTYDGSNLGGGNRWPTVVRQNPTPQAESYMIRVDAGSTRNNNLRWLVRTTNGVVAADWAFAPGALNAWTHVAGTFDGTKLELIVNGQVVSTRAASGTLVDQGGPLRIGNGDLSVVGAEAWAGDIDEVRLWPFARTAAEIRSTMMAQLEAVPGLVSTWNLNGNLNDSSGSNPATAIGPLTYVPSGPALQPYPFPGFAAFGAPTPDCLGIATVTATALPTVGEAAFALMCIGAPANTNGLAAFSGAGLSSPLPIAGFDLWLDVTHPAFFTLFTPSDRLGASRLALPVPNLPALRNQQVYTQYVWVNGNCTTQFLRASGGLVVIVL